MTNNELEQKAVAWIKKEYPQYSGDEVDAQYLWTRGAGGLMMAFIAGCKEGEKLVLHRFVDGLKQSLDVSVGETITEPISYEEKPCDCYEHQDNGD